MEGAEGRDFVSDTKLANDLEKLGFKTHHIRRTLETLSGSSALAASLLRNGSPMDAAIQYLVLSCPECDLPQRFLPANNSSAPFVASAHSGKEDLRVRWMEDRASKEAGFPAATVKECSADPRVDGTFAHLVSMLDSVLLGEEWAFHPVQGDPEPDTAERRQDEIDALQAVYPDAHYDASTLELRVPLPELDTDLALHVLFSALHPYPRGVQLPAMYITASDLPPYVRLHILAQTLGADLGEPDEGRLFAAVEAALSAYEVVRTQGPPEMSDVMMNLLPRASKKPKKKAQDGAGTMRAAGTARKRARNAMADDRTSERVRSEWDAVTKSDKYLKLLETRRNLPSYALKDEIVQVVEDNRVLVLVGSTGA